MGKVRAPWSYPACPACVTDVFVTAREGRPIGEFCCHFCGEIFTREVQDE